MNFFPKLIILFVLLLSSFRMDGTDYPVNTLSRALKYAAKIWPDEMLGVEPLISNPTDVYYAPEDTVFMLMNENSDRIGYLIVSSAMGRFERFDFMVVYNKNLEVLDIRVLVYRSEHGSQITSRAWLKQFYGPIPGEDRIYGSDVDALSGATFSAKSITQQVSRLNRMMMGLLGK